VVHLTEKQTIVVGTLRSINHVSTSKVKDAKEFVLEFNDFCDGVMKSRESLVSVTACHIVQRLRDGTSQLWPSHAQMQRLEAHLTGTEN